MAENGPPSKKDFFISYNKADREWAEWVAWLLEESDYTVAIQAWDFGPGSNFVIEMDRAIQECDRVVAVLSPDYLTSLFTKPEWAGYFAQDPTSENRRIVPVRVRECELKGLLAPIVYADLVGKPENEAKAALLDAVKLGRRKPGSAPDFPGRKIVNKPRFPGSLPDIWNVPHLRNPNFTEPDQRLSEMHDALRSGKPAALTQALAGLGGVGKTQLAIEYVYRHAADYALVWWVRSEQAATLAADYAALATELDLPEKGASEQPLIITAVREALQHRRGWLLVFDNANAPEEIRGYLPAAGGHVLITSRHAVWSGVAHRVEVKKWAPEVAIEFLLKRTNQTDLGAAAELARALDYLPLALEQAAAYIDSRGKTLAGYLSIFRAYQLEVFNHGELGTDSATVATTWEVSFQQVEKESPTGAALLSLCAFLAPDDIPRDVITNGAELLPEPLCTAVGDDLAFDDAIGTIRRYSLIETGGEATLSLHRLVQTVIRSRLGEDGQKRWAGAALSVVNKAFPRGSEDVLRWMEYNRLLPHALAVVEFAEPLSVGLGAVVELFNQMGQYSSGRAEYAQAKAAFKRAIQIAEKVYSPDHRMMGVLENNLGSVLKDLFDLRGAQAAYERALRIREKVLGPDDPELTATINNLGLLLLELGDLPGARVAIERALQIDERTLGPDDPTVAIDVSNLGLVLNKLGDLPGAKAAFERALRIHEEALGPDHPTVAIDVNNIGTVLLELNDLPSAKAFIERALRIEEKALGPAHPSVARRVHNLGRVLEKLRDLSGAKAAFEQALSIAENAFGPDHPQVAGHANHLGSVLQELGDLSRAKAAFEQALRIEEKAFGPDHPTVAGSVNDLGGVLQVLGNLAAAKAAFERALMIDEKTFGPDHPTVGRRFNNLGGALQALGELPEAKKAFERSLKIAEGVSGPDHPDVATGVNNLGGVLQSLGDLAGAKAAYERALIIFQTALGEDHPSTCIVRDNLASLVP